MSTIIFRVVFCRLKINFSKFVSINPKAKSMKIKLFLLILIASSQLLFAQSKIDHLKLQRKTVSDQIEKLSDSLKKIDIKIRDEEKIVLISQLESNGITPILAEVYSPEMPFYTRPDGESTKYTSLLKGTMIKILDVGGNEEQYLKIEYQDKIGYILPYHLKKTPEISKLIESLKLLRSKEKGKLDEENNRKYKILDEENSKKQRALAEERRKNDLKTNKIKEEQQAVQLAKRKQKLSEKYGNDIATRIVSKEIWLGMTVEMAVESWGRPQENNRTVGSWGVHEQWVYSISRYLYFENGILTSWQD